jgi:hypothetical protein
MCCAATRDELCDACLILFKRRIERLKIPKSQLNFAGIDK